MARRQDQNRLNRIYKTIQKNPGNRPGRIARLLGEPRSQITRSLPALEAQGYLLSEDQSGGLWPFRRK